MEEKTQPNDSYGTDINEINTYDSPFSPLGNGSQSPPAPPKKAHSCGRMLIGIYKFIATAMVVMTIIFSASELIDFFVSDMDADNIFLSKVFGASRSDSGDFFEFIVNLGFGELSPTSSTEAEDYTPPTDTVPPDTGAPPLTQGTKPPPAENTPPETTLPLMPSPIPENCHPIVSMDISLLSYGSNFIYNNTSLSPDISVYAKQPLKKIYHADGPLVLVIHTHGTEAFMREGDTYYSDSGEIARSKNTEENVISVGKEFTDRLIQNGINAIHCTVMHDLESYRDSYSRSAETIRYYLSKYPSIQYVFDIHRDSLMNSSEELISAVTYVNGERYAQIMPVVGSGYGGYESNLILALKLRAILNDKYTSVSRPICLRESQYNQSLAPVSLLLEIGTSGNTLSEAKRSAILTADAITELIKSQAE